jgi:hypothetical protein
MTPLRNKRVQSKLRSKQTQHMELAEAAAMEVMRVGLLAEEAAIETQEAVSLSEEAVAIALEQAAVLGRAGSQAQLALLKGEQQRDLAAMELRNVEARGLQYAAALETLRAEGVAVLAGAVEGAAAAVAEAKQRAGRAAKLLKKEEYGVEDKEQMRLEQEARMGAKAAEEKAKVSAVAEQLAQSRLNLAREQLAGAEEAQEAQRVGEHGDALAVEFATMEEQRGPVATSYALITTAHRDAVASCARADKLVFAARCAVTGARGHFARLQDSAEQVGVICQYANMSLS